jgi:hypothetical protein
VAHDAFRQARKKGLTMFRMVEAEFTPSWYCIHSQRLTRHGIRTAENTVNIFDFDLIAEGFRFVCLLRTYLPQKRKIRRSAGLSSLTDLIVFGLVGSTGFEPVTPAV